MKLGFPSVWDTLHTKQEKRAPQNPVGGNRETAFNVSHKTKSQSREHLLGTLRVNALNLEEGVAVRILRINIARRKGTQRWHRSTTELVKVCKLSSPSTVEWTSQMLKDCLASETNFVGFKTLGAFDIGCGYICQSGYRMMLSAQSTHLG